MMTGLAVLGPNFTTDEPANNPQYFRNLSLILMTVRSILVAKHGIVAWYIRGYRITLLTIGLVILIFFTAATVYLGVVLAFTNTTSTNAFIGWYVVLALEAVAVITTLPLLEAPCLKGHCNCGPVLEL